MGRGLARALAPHHEVTLGSRDPDGKAKIAAKAGADVASYRDAVRGAKVVIVTVPWSAMDSALPELGALTRTVVIDVSNPYSQAERDTLKGTSTGEELQRRLPKARVCKAWSHVHHSVLAAPEV